MNMKRVIIPLLFLLNVMQLVGQANVGIGTTEPTYPLTVVAVNNKGLTQVNGSVEVGFFTSVTSAYLQTWSNHPISFATNSSNPQVFMNVFGNVGVGNTTPTQKLDVDGTLRMRGGTPAAGKILESNGDGLAEWKSRNTSGTRTLYVPFAAFLGSSSFMMHETVNGVSRYSPGYLAETYRYQAPLNLPVGTLIKDITWYYFDNNAERNLDFKLVSNNGGDAKVEAITSSSGTLNVDWSRNIVVNLTLGNTFYWLEISSFSWSSDESLRFKGALITYEE